MTKSRASGILLHITSLPSKYGIGDFGPEAYRFADFLAQANQRYWQALPLCPPSYKSSYSPYDGLSAFAGNALLISPEQLYREGLLSKRDIRTEIVFPKARVDYRSVVGYKLRLLKIAFERFRMNPRKSDYELFCSENKGWLEDFAMFSAFYRHFGYRSWCDWPAKIRDRNKQALKSLRLRLIEHIDRQKFQQYLFFRQWFSLKRYCNQHDIDLIGDIPIYVSYNSSDLWAYPENFKLTRKKQPRFIAGVPPDFFSRSGQLWGNPIYNWRVLKDNGYSWWVKRIKHNLALFDIVRIDHFRGFVAFWQVPAGDKTAENGKWVKGPNEDFFNILLRHFPSKLFIVEDLGHITKDVRMCIEKFHLSGMRVLLFAFEGNPLTNPHCPHNHVKNSVVYTSTHDCNTVKGWFEKQAKREEKKRFFDYLGRRVPAEQLHWEFIRLAMSSVSDIVIIAMQDVLGLSTRARMNRPATVTGNWRWRLCKGQINQTIIRKLAKLTKIYGRI